MTQTGDRDIFDIVRELFPLPDRNQLMIEAAQDLPFGKFGVRGGFGETRRALVAHIEGRSGVMVVAHYYHQLIVEGLIDDHRDTDLWDGPCPHTLADLADDLKAHVESEAN